MEMEPFNYPNPLGHIGGVKQVYTWNVELNLNFRKFRKCQPKRNKFFPQTPQIRAEAAYLYDAVHLYARALIKILESNENPKNGTAIIDYIKGTSYSSAMGWVRILFHCYDRFISHFYKITARHGINKRTHCTLVAFAFYRYLVYIDENGDAAGNYTILSINSSQNNTNEYGLYPIGTFNAPQLIEIPVSFEDFFCYYFVHGKRNIADMKINLWK